jgi:hypothetical protein
VPPPKNGDGLPEALERWEGIPDRTILILTAEKLDDHLQEHAALKRRVYAAMVLGMTAFGASIVSYLLRLVK